MARFAATLFGEHVRPDDIITESYVQRDDPAEPYCPPPPDLEDVHDIALTQTDDADVVALTERLTGRPCAPTGPIAERVVSALAGNRVVHALEEYFRTPHTVAEAADYLCRHLPERQTTPPAAP